MIRVGTACPIVRLGKVDANVDEALALVNDALKHKVNLVVFPELSLTGYTIGDLLNQDELSADVDMGVARLVSDLPAGIVVAVGVPFRWKDALYDCGVLLERGRILGIVPKQHLPNYNEFYERRWFAPGRRVVESVQWLQQDVSFGGDLLFRVAGALVGVEICEDLWVADPPSRRLAQMGAEVIANLSASPEQVAKSDYRRSLVVQQSGRLICGYAYAGCDASESTQDIVMSGHQIITSNGGIVAERAPLAQENRMLVADIDLDHLRHDRRRSGQWGSRHRAVVVESAVPASAAPASDVDRRPFLRGDYLSTLAIQAQGLATRIQHVHLDKVVLGLSGGLDSSLALLVGLRAVEILGRTPRDLIHLVTMPAAASSERTKSQARRLAEFFDLPLEVIPIRALADKEAGALGVNSSSFVYGSIQARLRTALLMNRAASLGGFMLGTSDLSEIAMGFSTFGGDHLSHYDVNAGVPKTLVRALVLAEGERLGCPVLRDIAETPISPELMGHDLEQRSEGILGDYELNDFFLYHLIRWGESSDKIVELAQRAFPEVDAAVAFSGFYRRFCESQWKRSVMPDGPKVGSVSLSPRGDWRMPADY